MTVPTLQRAQSQSDSPRLPHTRHRRRGRAGVVACLIVSLLATAGLRYVTDERREQLGATQLGGSSRTSLSSMNSFALTLLLGGLRGPLVMMLWSSSENQKADKNLEDFDTKVEWIRRLQPEFDTVHIFEIWNKAYNISVQMATLGNKYTTILDAIDYGQSVDREKPDDINILSAIARIYGDKLGDSQEKTYYRRRVRKETLPHPQAQRLSRNDPGWRRLEIDPMLDTAGNLLPQLLQPRPHHERPADLPAESAWNDGSDLQYLAPFQPFPYGLSPNALAYNYYKRSQVLQQVNNQHDVQLSESVVDTRPALALKSWAEEEWELGRRCELAAFALPVPAERLDMELSGAAIPLGRAATDAAAARQAIFCYQRAAALVAPARAEYERHLRQYPDAPNAGNYVSHIHSLEAMAPLCLADAEYLQAMTAQGPQRQTLLAAARQHYIQSIHAEQVMILKYCVDPYISDLAYPKGYAPNANDEQKGIEQLPVEQLAGVIEASDRVRIQHFSGRDNHSDDRQEYDRYIQRAQDRLKLIPQG